MNERDYTRKKKLINVNYKEAREGQIKLDREKSKKLYRNTRLNRNYSDYQQIQFKEWAEIKFSNDDHYKT